MLNTVRPDVTRFQITHIGAIIFLLTISWMIISGWQLLPSSPHLVSKSRPTVNLPKSITYETNFDVADPIACNGTNPDSIGCHEAMPYGYGIEPEEQTVPYFQEKAAQRQRLDVLIELIGVPLAIIFAAITGRGAYQAVPVRRLRPAKRIGWHRSNRRRREARSPLSCSNVAISPAQCRYFP